MKTARLKTGNHRPVSDTICQISHVVLSEDTNPLHILRGGRLLEWMDLASEITAQKHAHGVALTASAHEIRFLRKIRVGDIVNIQSRITRVFNTSMEILVEVFTMHIPDMRPIKSTEAYFTLVAFDLEGNPIHLMPVKPESELEIQLYKLAGKRRKMNLKTKPPDT